MQAIIYCNNTSSVTGRLNVMNVPVDSEARKKLYGVQVCALLGVLTIV
jgi:hypothetical protein